MMIIFQYPVVFGNAPEPPTENMKRLRKELKFFNDMATKRNRNFFTGSDVTLADISCIATVTSLEAIEFDFDEFPKIKEWIERMKDLDFYKECNKGYEQWKKEVKTEEWREKMKAKREKMRSLE